MSKSVQGQGQCLVYFLSSLKPPYLNEDPLSRVTVWSLPSGSAVSCKNKVWSVIFMQFTSAHQYAHLHLKDKFGIFDINTLFSDRLP